MAVFCFGKLRMEYQKLYSYSLVQILFTLNIIIFQTAIYIMFPHKMQWGMTINKESLQKYKRTLPRNYKFLGSTIFVL